MEKRFLNSLDEILTPRHTALVILDMQNDFCLRAGAFGAAGAYLDAFPPVIASISRLLAAARAPALRVIHVGMVVLPGRDSDSSAMRWFNRRANNGLVYTVEGTWGAETITDLQPIPGEVTVRKRRQSAFWGTDLDLLLRSWGVRTIVLCGCVTEGCVESTARDALFADYHVVVVEDGVASYSAERHAASMLLLRHRFDVLPAREISAILGGSRCRGAMARVRFAVSGIIRSCD